MAYILKKFVHYLNNDAETYTQASGTVAKIYGGNRENISTSTPESTNERRATGIKNRRKKRKEFRWDEERTEMQTRFENKRIQTEERIKQ